MLPWARGDPPRAGEYQAVRALSSGTLQDSSLSDAGIDRLRAAIALTHELRVNHLITTRVRARKEPGLFRLIAGARAVDSGPTSDWAQRRMIAPAGLLPRWTITTGIVHSTREEAVRAVESVGAPSEIVVVTSPLHPRRACAVFEHVGFRVTCRPSREDHWLFMPFLFAYEIAAAVKYKRNGWW